MYESTCIRKNQKRKGGKNEQKLVINTKEKNKSKEDGSVPAV